MITPGMQRRLISSTAAAALSLVLPSAAKAHHPTGGMLPASWSDGFLSGIGHPVLGPYHLAFIVGAAILMAASRRWAALPALFVAGLVPGVLSRFGHVVMTAPEMLVALSVLLLGAALLVEAKIAPAAGQIAVALAGFVHGYAFGETIIGAEPTPVAAYLAGLSVTTASIMIVLANLTRAIVSADFAALRLRQAAGAALVLGGGAFAVSAIV